MSNNKPSDPTLVFIKISRILSYFVYAYAVIASVFLSIGFVLLLFSANSTTPFVKFIYNGAAEFLQPFRGMFPPHQVTETGYFSASALFAIMMYLILAVALKSLISYITLKMVRHEQELQKA